MNAKIQKHTKAMKKHDIRDIQDKRDFFYPSFVVSCYRMQLMLNNNKVIFHLY